MSRKSSCLRQSSASPALNLEELGSSWRGETPQRSADLLNWLSGPAEAAAAASAPAARSTQVTSNATLDLAALESARNAMATDPLFEKRAEIQRIIDSLPAGEARDAYQATLATLGEGISEMPTFNEPLVVNGPISSTGIVTAPTFDEVSTDLIAGWYYDGRPVIIQPISQSRNFGLLEVIKIDDNNYRVRVYGHLPPRPAPQLVQADFTMTRVGSLDIFQADGNLLSAPTPSFTRICPIVSSGERFLMITNGPRPNVTSTANPLTISSVALGRKITPQSARHLLEKGATYRDALLNCHSPEELLKFWIEMFASLNITGNERMQLIDPFAAPTAPRRILDYRLYGNQGRKVAEKYINLFKTTGFRIGGRVKRVEKGLLDGTIKITMEDEDFVGKDFNFLPFAGGLPVYFEGTGYSVLDSVPFTCSIAGGFTYAKPPPKCFDVDLMEKGIMHFHVEVPLILTEKNNKLSLVINGAPVNIEIAPGYYRFLDVLLQINKELQKIHPSLYIWFYNGTAFDYVNQVPLTTVFPNKAEEIVYIRSDLSQNVALSPSSTILDLLGLKTASNALPIQRQSGTSSLRLIVGERPAVTNAPVDGFLRILNAASCGERRKPLIAQTPHMQMATASFIEMLTALHCFQRLMNLEEHVLTAGCGITAEDAGRWYPTTWDDMGFFMRSYFSIFGAYPSTNSTQMQIIEPARFYTDLKLSTANLLTSRFPLGDVSSILAQNYRYTADCIANLGSLPFKNNLTQFMASPLLTRYMRAPKKIQALLASEIPGPVRPVSRVLDAFNSAQPANITSGGNILLCMVEPSIVLALTGTSLKVGYICFPDMIMSNNTNDAISLFQDDEISVGMPQTRQYMRAAFQFFKNQGVDRVIVDLRGNSGGNMVERPFLAHIGSTQHLQTRSRFNCATALQELNCGADVSDAIRYVRSLEGGPITREEKCLRTDYSLELEPSAQFRLTEGRILTLAGEQSYSAAKAFQNDLKLRSEVNNGFLDADRKVDYFNLSVYGRPFSTGGASMASVVTNDHLTTGRSEYPINPFLGIQRWESGATCYAGSRLPVGDRLTWADANPNTGLEYFFRDIGLIGKAARDAGVADFSRTLPAFRDVEFGRPWTYRDSNFERAIQIICDPNCRANAAADLRYGSTIVRNSSGQVIRDLPAFLPRIW